RGPFHPGDLRPSGVRGPPLSLPPMGARPTKPAAEAKPLRRDKAHEERSVLENALASSGPVAQKPEATTGSVPAAARTDPGPIGFGESGPLLLRVLRHGVPQVEVQVEPFMTVQQLKMGLAMQLHIPVEDQRLFWKSCFLQDNRSLLECGLVNGEHDLVLVPGLSHRATGLESSVAPICARRGLNMVPSGPSLPWKPSKHSRIRHEDLQVYFGDAAPLPPMDVGDVRLKAIEFGSG
ncbi:unnamed protein product, partial [Symbiodinium sp. KB8]